MIGTNKTPLISELQRQLKIYDQKRSALLYYLEQLHDDQLRRKPGQENWSLLEIVQHMVL